MTAAVTFRGRVRLVLAVLILALALLAPSAALAQDGNPFDGQLPPAAPTPAPTVEPVDNAGDGDIGRTTLFAIGGGLLIAVLAIGVWISRDARRNLPADERERLDHQTLAHKHEKQAKAKARAKGRAQRRARKTTRKKARR